MASGNIKGITIEIGGDTTGLDNALKDVNKQAKNLQTELKEVERGLKLDPGNVTLVAQKQQILTQSIEATSDKLHVLRQAQGQVEQQFRNGEIGEEQYRAFRRELVNTENNMNSLQGQLSSLQSEQQRLSETTRSLGAFFDATGTDVEQFAGTLGTRLTQAIRDGSASADQMERALRLMGRQALGASTDIDEMRRVLSQINNGGSIDAIRTELQQMNTVVVTTQDELKQIDNLLKFNPNNVELLAQKQTLLTRSIQDTSTELQQLQQRQSQVEAQFQSGQIGEEQYRAFRRELEQTEQSLVGYQNQLNAMQQEQQQVQTSTRHLQTLFDATGTSVDQFADAIGNDLVRAIQEGRASSAQIEQAINQIGRASLGAGQDLEEFRNALRNADNGAPIDEIRQDLERLRQDADQATDSVEKMGGKMDALGDGAKAAAAGVAAFGVAAGLSAAQFDNATGQIQAALGVTREEAEALEDSAKSVWKDGFGESLEDVASGLIRVKQNMKQIDGSEVEKVTKNAIALAKTFESDVNEVTRAGNNLMVNFGLSADEAFDLMAKGAQNGLNFSNEMFDNLAEYAPLFANMGYSAEEYFGILQRGSEAGVYNLDYINDVMKEFQIRVKDGSKATSDAMGELSKSTQKVWKDFLNGKGTVADVAAAVVPELQAMDDQVTANQIGVGVFGTKWEDLEAKAMYAMLGTKEGLEGAQGAMDALAQAQEQTFGQRWESFTRTAAASLEPLGKILLDLAEEWLPKVIETVEGVAKWFSDLTPTMQGVTVAIGAVVGAIGPLIMIVGSLISSISGIVGLFTSGGIAAGAFSTAIAAMTGPVGLAVAAVAGIGVAVGLLAHDLSQSSIEVEGWEGKVSKATVETLGSFMELSDNATVALNQMNWSGQAVTQDMAAKIVETFANMGNQVLAEMQADHAAQLTELQNFYAQSSVLTDEQEAKALAKAQTYQTNRQQVITDGMARIKEITSTAATERRELTLAEEAEINRIHEQMKEAAVKHMSESAEEQKVILEALKNEASEITAAQAAEVVKNSVKQKDETVAEAQKQYEESLKIIMEQRDELGVISEEQAELLIREAQRQRDKTIESAEEMHENVVSEAKKQADEHVEQVDWTTGELKSKWQVMKEDTTKKMKETGAAIKRDWTNAYNDTVKKVGDIVSSVGKFFSDKVKTVGTKMAEVKQKIESKWGEAQAFLKGIDLIQIGKDIVNGLITGISNKFDGVKKKIEELAGLIPEWAKDILGIHSPSRVMKVVGQDTIDGLVVGMDSKSDTVKKAVSTIGNLMIDETKKYSASVKDLEKKQADELAKIENDKAYKINQIVAKAKASKKKLTTAQNAQIDKIESDAAQKSISVQQKYNDQIIKLQQELDKKKLDSVKQFISDKKGLEQINIIEEALVWAEAANQFTKGSNAHIQAQMAYRDSLKTIQTELTNINTTYANKVISINQQLQDAELKLTDAYTKAVDDRAKSLVSFASLFDAFDATINTTGKELLSNLESQVSGFEEWQKEIETLSEKAIDKGLLEELRQMGPKALGELRGLNSLSETELTKYSQLYKQKMELARKQSISELQGLKADTDKQIKELRAAANSELTQLEKDWAAQLKSLTKTSKDELSSLNQVGKDAVSGLMNGMGSMQGSLESKVREIAQTIIDTTKSVLDIHSPSRVMRAIGINVGEGLAIGIERSSDQVLDAAEAVIEKTKKTFEELPSLIKKYGEEVFKDYQSVYDKYYEIRWKTGDGYGVESLRFLKAAIENEKIAVHERIRLQDLYNEHMELAPYYLADLQKDYNDKVIQMEANRVARQKELLAEYEAEVVKKTGEILKQYGLLDKVEIKSTGVDEITSSLESQIESLELYNESIAKLSLRGLDSSLLNEISSLGPKMAGEVAAFANMTDEELARYVGLWEEKQRLARETAEVSLEATRLEMQAQLQQINEDAERELEGFKDNFEFLFKEVNGISSSEMAALENTLVQDGANAMQGLINGMESMRSSIISTAQSIAEAVSSTIQGALDIHSPSRVMKGFGINIGEGLVTGMDNMIAKVAQSSARLSDAAQSAHASLANSASRSASVMSPATSSSSTVDNSKHFNPSVVIHTTDSGAKEMHRVLRKMAFSF